MGIVVQGHRPNSCNKGTQKDVLTIISNPATEQVTHRWSAIRYHQMMNSGQCASTLYFSHGNKIHVSAPSTQHCPHRNGR